jgi:hypothetical protein
MRTFIFRTKPSAHRLIDRIDRLRPYRDKSTSAALPIHCRRGLQSLRVRSCQSGTLRRTHTGHWRESVAAAEAVGA